MIENARGAVKDEPGCLKFDVIQDADDDHRIWLYEVYTGEVTFGTRLTGS